MDDGQIKNQQVWEMKDFFLHVVTQQNCVDPCIERAKSIPQAELRKVKPKVNDDVTAFVIPHNPANPNVAAWSNNMRYHENKQKAGEDTEYNNSYAKPTPTIKLNGHLNTRQIYCKTKRGGSTKC